LSASDSHSLHLALRINIKDGIRNEREKNVLNMDEIMFKFSKDNHRKRIYRMLDNLKCWKHEKIDSAG
jgi:hypothetical protein